MVMHEVDVSGVQLSGATQAKPVVLQMNREDFPGAFLRDLAATGKPQLSSTQTVVATASVSGTLYQPVARVVHVALVELSCKTVGYPRLDPTRVVSAGLVIRRVPRTNGISELSKPPASAWPWMKNSNGQFGWNPAAPWSPDNDPDATLRPQLQSGRPELDRLLAAKSLSTALSEVTTPAFAAAPDVCAAAGRTFVYALVPTASSESSTQQSAAIPKLDNSALLQTLPVLLKAGSHSAPQANQPVNYQFMSDDWVRANNKTDFLTFSATLRMLYTVFGAFDGSPAAHQLLTALNRRSVTVNGASQKIGDFFHQAAARLIDYDPNSSAGAAPQLQMPSAWEYYNADDQTEIQHAMLPLLQSRTQAASQPQGRFQDATRLYRLRMFFRIKGETPACPPCLVWSNYSDPFRIAAWYESGGRAATPVPMPDPFDRQTLQNAKGSAAFAVPPRLMNAMNGANLTSLSAGTSSPPPSGSGIDIIWICNFSIPLITICAFFVLNIFISLLNFVFFWMAFIKICLPFPVPAPSSSPVED